MHYKLWYWYCTLLIYGCLPASAQRLDRLKQTAIQLVDSRSGDLVRWSQSLWDYAEPSLQETKSAALIIDVLRQEGFTVKENVSDFPTVFIASYGSSGPVIGVFGEYDADPGASNKIVPRKEPIPNQGYGHGGHHNLLGVGSLGAALAIKDLIKSGKLKCTVRYYGTSAEGSVGTKSYLARDGHFDDLDFSVYWHPSPVTSASPYKWDASATLDIEFYGKKVDVLKEVPSENTTMTAFESLIQCLSVLRQRNNESIRINYQIKAHTHPLNQIPDTVRVSVIIQCAFQRDLMETINILQQELDLIETKANTPSAIRVRRFKHQFLPNVTAARQVHQNMMLLDSIPYTQVEQAFAHQVQVAVNMQKVPLLHEVSPFVDQSTRPKIYGWSSDIGDASWIAPEVYFSVRTLPVYQMHQWPGTIFSGYSIGHKGMIFAAKVISLTIIDFVQNKTLRSQIEQEFVEQTKHYRYRSLLPAD